MQKPTEDQLFFGALVLVTAWIFVALPLIGSWQAYQFAHPAQNSQPHDRGSKNNQSKPDESFWEKTSNDPVAYFTLWLVGFTGVLAVSTIGLWIVTRRSGIILASLVTLKHRLPKRPDRLPQWRR